LLKQGRQILLNLGYVIEARVLRILAQAVSKNIDPFRFYEHFTGSPKNDHLPRWGSSSNNISRSIPTNKLKL